MHVVRRSQPIMGTFVEIRLVEDSTPEIHSIMNNAFERAHQVDRLMSFFHPKSEVSFLNKYGYGRDVTVDPLTYQVLEEALRISSHSQGLFDITVRSPDPVDYRSIELKPHFQVRFHHPKTKIDLGGIAKGFAVDRMVHFLQTSGVKAGTVNAGGDLRVFGDCAFPVQIRNPFWPTEAADLIFMKNTALANSGHYFHQRGQGAGDATTHLVHATPENGSAIDETPIAAAGVQAHSCMRADALSKIIIFAGKKAKNLLEKFEARGYLIPHGFSSEIRCQWIQ